MARCNCGGAECGCNLAAGDNVTINGSGSGANPWTVNAVTNCAEVRQCLSANQGAAYNPATGVISVCVSPDANNALTRDANGCLYVQAGASTVVTDGCGLSGNGSVGDPLSVNTQAWPYTCDLGANATGVYCDPETGELRGDPPMRYDFFGQSINQTPATPITVPAGVQQTIRTITMDITNPDPCREAHVLLMREVDMELDLPINSRAGIGIDGAEVNSLSNTGNAMVDQTHALSTRLSEFTLAPGATQAVTYNMTAGGGSGGAVITVIKGALRAWVWSNVR